MHENSVAFSLAGQSAWAPGLAAPADWARWAEAPWHIAPGADAPVAAMPAMLRRRAGSLGRMALEVAYAVLGEQRDVVTVFCSRHGEVTRAIGLLDELVAGEPLSPTGFGLSVHNASAGLLSIARADRAAQMALAAGAASVEHGVIEACSLLADGAAMVLLVAYDAPLPALLSSFEDSREQPFAFAWAMVPANATAGTLRLSWCAAPQPADAGVGAQPGGLDVLRFQLGGAARMERVAEARRWTWSRDA
jgi:hypothetical protein